MKRIVLLITILISCQVTFGQLIPTQNSWQKVGYHDTVTTPATILNVLNFGAVADGLQNDGPAILAAIAALNGQSGIIYLPAGNYKIQNSLLIPDSVILRGAGADSTVLLFELNNSAVNSVSISKSQNTAFALLQVPALKGEKKLTLRSATTLVSGDWIELRQQNGSWDTNPASWAANAVGQISQVDSVSGQHVFLSDPLRISYDTTLQAEIRTLNPVTQVGIECLKIKRLDTPVSGAGYGIFFNYAVNCWVKGIESDSSVGSHIQAEASAYLTIRDSYFHHAHNYDGSATKGYGVVLAQHTGNVLIENNIFRFLRHAMMVKQGANGNVFGYNYSFEPNRTEFPSTAGGDISLHGHYPFANLFEGNIIQTIHIDQAWGPSGPRNTFFRNKAELFGLIMSSGAIESDSQVFVGNDIVHTGTFMGLYIVNGNGHFEFGNRVRGAIQPAGSTAISDSSLYLHAKPGFWSTNSSWPAIGTPLLQASATNPAYERVQNSGQFALCNSLANPPAPTSVPEFLATDYTVFPNPFYDKIRIKKERNNTGEVVQIRLVNMLGEKVFQKELDIHNQDFLHLPLNLIKGVYLLHIQSSAQIKVIKIIKE